MASQSKAVKKSGKKRPAYHRILLKLSGESFQGPNGFGIHGETIYAIKAPFFGPNEAYSAAPTFVGRLDPHTGNLTPVVTGMVSPHGMTFLAQ